MTSAREVVILGSTGSVGTQAIEVVRGRRDQFRVVGLAAGGSNIQLLADQILDVQPRTVALSRSSAAQDLQLALYSRARVRGWNEGKVTLPRLLLGPDAATQLAAEQCDVVLNAITGSAGLLPTLAALKAGRTLALANKESLVIGGRLVTEAARPGQLVAVDSEHSAFAQALRAGRPDEVRKLVLTASGGPFRGRTRKDLEKVGLDDALAHPTWAMGRVITINSATLVNKGLELLEAALLYGVDLAAVEVVVHPQSVVHSMVEFHDGSTIAQCSPPDMKLPIALGLSWPDRVADVSAPVDWTKAHTWTFEPLDSEVFGAVELARRCGRAAGTAPAVFNGANEECVEAFCEGRIGFTDIVDTVAAVVQRHLDRPSSEGGHVKDEELSVQAVLAADEWSRVQARRDIGWSA